MNKYIQLYREGYRPYITYYSYVDKKHGIVMQDPLDAECWKVTVFV